MFKTFSFSLYYNHQNDLIAHYGRSMSQMVINMISLSYSLSVFFNTDCYHYRLFYNLWLLQRMPLADHNVDLETTPTAIEWVTGKLGIQFWMTQRDTYHMFEICHRSTTRHACESCIYFSTTEGT